MSNDKLEKVLIKKENLEIEIFPPVGSDIDDKIPPQIIRISILRNFDFIPNSLDKFVDEYYKIANNFLLQTYSLIRLHSRQFLLGNPILSAIDQYSFSIVNDKGEQLDTERLKITIGIRPEDKNEFAIDKFIWNKVSHDLIIDKEAEVYFLLLLDAKYHVFAGRIREAIITTAVAIEQFTVEYLGLDKKEESKQSEEILKINFVDFFC